MITTDSISTAEKKLRGLLDERIVFLDGGMGTTIQRFKLEEEDFRGELFKNHPQLLKGNNDLLVLTKPDIIREIHAKYYAAGSDIVETNTFSGTTIAQADYFTKDNLAPHGWTLESFVHHLNKEAAKLARAAADEAMAKEPGRLCFVAGAIGPTNRTASLSPDVERPEFRNVSFDELEAAYYNQIDGLVAGGVDTLMIETIFDTLNAKAAIFAAMRFNDTRLEQGSGEKLPIMLSGTITDRSGRTLSGQTTEAFWNSVRHARPLSVGMNCALGGDLMRPYIVELSKLCDCYVSCYPNAGLPDPLSPTGYPEGPEDTAAILEGFAKDGLLNMVGGCCGTTPEHIAAIKQFCAKHPPRKPIEHNYKLKVSGLEALTIG